MRRIKPSRLRKILWNLMTHGKKWWQPKWKFGTTVRILNDKWVLNLRASLNEASNNSQSGQIPTETIPGTSL